MTRKPATTITAEDDYRRGLDDGEAGRAPLRGSDSYAAGWRVGAIFARDSAGPAESLESTAPTARTVDIQDVIAELPRGIWTP